MSQPSVIIATASYDFTIRFWEAQSASCYRAINYPAVPQRELDEGRNPQNVNKLEISPDKRHLAAACNPYIRLFDINFHHGHVRTFVAHTSNVTAVGFHADGNSMYSGSEDGTVRIWDLRYNQFFFQLKSMLVKDIHVLSNTLLTRKLKCRAPNRPEVYERNCLKAYHLDGSVTPINTVVLHPNQLCVLSHYLIGKMVQIELISGDQDGIIRVWDTRMNSCTIELVPEPDTAIRSLSVMRDGSMLAAANDGGTCYIWNIVRGSQVFFSLNSYLATASSDKTVKIWNVDSFTLDKVLTGHQRWVWDCAFSVDAKFILTASSDMTARLWSMEEGNELRVYRGHNKAIVCCALNDV
ncbi:hypothetical protein HID58_083078 [Brassica napus]|uniref:Target of rapamycin complex subunit LST8 n=1 Tax=Brassica napus TaxID=3708 RepID=A0ABQ7YCI7_BRANA|nr:hypothetical protein HID58_083078 [Brassica napus]